MKINIVGLGSSAKNWKGESPSIGVNDAGRWGHKLTYLMLLNGPNCFTPDRMAYIQSTKVNKVYTDLPGSWIRLLDKSAEVVPFISRKWSHSNRLQKVSKNYHYHSNTSPFAAISLAYSWGFTEIVLWGVDMVDHRVYKPGTGAFINEHASYKTFCASLKERGVNVYLGAQGSNLTFLPIYNESKH